MSVDPFLLSDAPSLSEEFNFGDINANFLGFDALGEFEESFGTNQAVDADFDELFDKIAGDAGDQAMPQGPGY